MTETMYYLLRPKIGDEQLKEFESILLKQWAPMGFAKTWKPNEAYWKADVDFETQQINLEGPYVAVDVLPRNFSYEGVMQIHDVARKMFDLEAGGTYGVKFQGQIESIISRSESEFYGVTPHPTVLDRAAFYWHEIATHQAFHNGNKRTSFLTALSYLTLNRYRLVGDDLDDAKFYDFTVEISNGKVNQEEIKLFLLKHVEIDIERMQKEVITNDKN